MFDTRAEVTTIPPIIEVQCETFTQGLHESGLTMLPFPPALTKEAQ